LFGLSLSAERIVAHPSGFWNSDVRHGFGNMNQQQSTLRSTHNALCIGQRPISFPAKISRDKHFREGRRWSNRGCHNKSPTDEGS
jgi:hypothetical protein